LPHLTERKSRGRKQQREDSACGSPIEAAEHTGSRSSISSSKARPKRAGLFSGGRNEIARNDRRPVFERIVGQSRPGLALPLHAPQSRKTRATDIIGWRNSRDTPPFVPYPPMRCWI
jgi:hypothetical protein